MALEGTQASTTGQWHLVAQAGDLTALVYHGMQLGEDAAGRFTLSPSEPLIELGIEHNLLTVQVLTSEDGTQAPPLYVNADTSVRVNLSHDQFLIDPSWVTGRERGDVIDIQVQPTKPRPLQADAKPPATKPPPNSAAQLTNIQTRTRPPERWMSEREFGVLVAIGMLMTIFVLFSLNQPEHAPAEPTPDIAAATPAQSPVNEQAPMQPQASATQLRSHETGSDQTAGHQTASSQAASDQAASTEAENPNTADESATGIESLVEQTTPELTPSAALTLADVPTDTPEDTLETQTRNDEVEIEAPTVIQAATVAPEAEESTSSASTDDSAPAVPRRTALELAAAPQDASSAFSTSLRTDIANEIDETRVTQLSDREEPVSIPTNLPSNGDTFGAEVTEVVSLLDALPLSVGSTDIDETPAVVTNLGAVRAAAEDETPDQFDALEEISFTPALVDPPETTTSDYEPQNEVSGSGTGQPLLASLTNLSPQLPAPQLPAPAANETEPEIVESSLYPYGELRVVRQRAPVYPRRAPDGASGYVDVEFTVDETGRVADVEVQGNPPDYFARAAVNAVRKWRFEAVREAGRPVAVRTMLRLSFQG